MQESDSREGGSALADVQLPRVAVVGGSGRLGGHVVSELLAEGHEVTLVDKLAPPSGSNVSFRWADVSDDRSLEQAFVGCDVVIHLAALHGLHLAQGVSRSSCWDANVRGTKNVLAAAMKAGVRRIVLASSTSVYGPGSARGSARILDEGQDVNPEDIYDVSKLACERMLEGWVQLNTGADAIVLRFGRFFFGRVADYHLRKLSTGLDVDDASQAVRLAVNATMTPSTVRRFVIASDLPLDRDSRSALGVSVSDVLANILPDLVDELRRYGWRLPLRVGKAADTSHARMALGYRPAKDLAWWTESLRERRTSAGVLSPVREPMLEDDLSSALLNAI